MTASVTQTYQQGSRRWQTRQRSMKTLIDLPQVVHFIFRYFLLKALLRIVNRGRLCSLTRCFHPFDAAFEVCAHGFRRVPVDAPVAGQDPLETVVAQLYHRARLLRP